MKLKDITKIYEDILRLLKVVIERDFKPCRLEGFLKKTLYELTTTAVEEDWSGWKIIVSGVFKVVGQAKYCAEKYDKDLCHYLNMALERKGIENFVLAFRKYAK